MSYSAKCTVVTTILDIVPTSKYIWTNYFLTMSKLFWVSPWRANQIAALVYPICSHNWIKLFHNCFIVWILFVAGRDQNRWPSVQYLLLILDILRLSTAPVWTDSLVLESIRLDVLALLIVTFCISGVCVWRIVSFIVFIVAKHQK